MFDYFCQKQKPWKGELKTSKSGFLEGAGKRRWGGGDAGDTSLNTLNKVNVLHIFTQY